MSVGEFSRRAMPQDSHADGDDLPLALRDAVHALRAEVPVRAEWRAAVLHAIDETSRDAHRRPATHVATSRRTLAIRPLAAIAACLACMAIGATAMRIATSHTASAVAAPSEVASRTGATRDAGTVRFVLVAPGAAHVSVVGDFNDWNPATTPLRATHDGRTWTVDMPLAPGRHVYAFVVDGDVMADPSAPRVAGDDFGVPNSVVLVGSAST